ncbi:MAG TPA: GAP family protein [Aldersonia sp.]
MPTVLGEVLPLAVGVAVSPIPVIAAILMLLSPNAKTTGVGFLCGWVVGIAVAATLFTVLSSSLPADTDGTRSAAAYVQILLGVGLLVLALRQWRARPAEGAEPTMPAWMSAIDSFTPVRGFGLGFVLSAVNPKNLLLGIAAGVSIGQGGLTVAQDAVVIAVFTVLAASTVAVPVIAFLLSPARWTVPLQSLRAWLTRNNATVMAVLLLVIGSVVIGKGLGNL